MPAAGGYPAAAGGGVPQSCMGHATAAPVAYANSTPAADTSMIMMGTVLLGPGQESWSVIQLYPAISSYDRYSCGYTGYSWIWADTKL